MRHMAATSTLFTLLMLTMLVSQTVSRSTLTRQTRSDAGCPTLCVIDQTQGRILRLVQGTYLPELYMERCETPCAEHCLISQDPQTPQIVAHICSPDSVLCNHRHDSSCRRHVVVSMDHRISFSVGPGPQETDGPQSAFDGSTTLFTRFNLPTGLIKDLGTATTTTTATSVTWISSTSTTSPRSHVDFEDTESTEEYVTATRRQQMVCSETTFGCPTRGKFCFGVVMKLGIVSYGCYPDKPVCSSIEGCVRVCLPSLESCHKTASPSISWGTSTSTPGPTEEIPEVPDPTEDPEPEEDKMVPEEEGPHAEDKEIGHPDLKDKGDPQDPNEENNTISEEPDSDLKNEWSDLENEEQDPGENETEKDPNSASVALSYSVLLHLALVLGSTMV